MLHIHVFRVADGPDTRPAARFVDKLDGARDHVGLFFAEPEFREQGVSLMAHLLTIQSQGWADCAKGTCNPHPPLVRVLRVKVKPGQPGIEIRDDDDALTYRIDEDWITRAGALGFEAALRKRVCGRRRLGGTIGYLSPEPQYQLG